MLEAVPPPLPRRLRGVYQYSFIYLYGSFKVVAIMRYLTLVVYLSVGDAPLDGASTDFEYDPDIQSQSLITA